MSFLLVLHEGLNVSCTVFCLANDRVDALTDFQIDWLDSPPESSSTGWKNSFYFEQGYIQALIQGSGAKGRFLFPCIRQGKEIIAWGCFQELILYREELDELGRLFASDSRFAIKVEGLVKSLIHLGSGKKGIRILIAGNCQVTGPYGMTFSPHLSDSVKSECWSNILKQAEQQFGPYSITLVKDFNDNQDLIIDSLRTDGFRRVPTLPVMRFHLDKSWNQYEDYLNAMASKYRIRAKAARKKGVKLQREIWTEVEIKEHLEQINQLYRNVFDKARFRLFRISPNYFLHLKQAFQDRFLFKAYLFDGKLVGFSTFLIDSVQSDAHLIGIDYSANKQFSLYQNMLYDYVDTAIEHRTACIDFGRTAMEIKSTIGAIPEDSPVIVKMRNPLLNGMACILVENSTPAPWIQRHPFREEEHLTLAESSDSN